MCAVAYMHMATNITYREYRHVYTTTNIVIKIVYFTSICFIVSSRVAGTRPMNQNQDTLWISTVPTMLSYHLSLPSVLQVVNTKLNRCLWRKTCNVMSPLNTRILYSSVLMAGFLSSLYTVFAKIRRNSLPAKTHWGFNALQRVPQREGKE